MGLVAVSQDSMMAEQASNEGAINICREYRRCAVLCSSVVCTGAQEIRVLTPPLSLFPRIEA